MIQWLKVIHILAVISWMAGLLYLPRLFVYHAEQGAKADVSAVFKIMEGRLLKYIMRPAMMVTWITGLGLAYSLGFHKDIWLILKLLLVIAMTAAHVFFLGCHRAFLEDRNTRDSKFFRIMNEVPTVLMIGIVILVVLKPF
jgi:protoporphyrinogen IX oxidase